MFSLAPDCVTTGAIRSNFYVYGLYAKERFQRLFYVGKGCNKRMFDHFKCTQNKTHKSNVIAKYTCYTMPIIGGLTEKFAYALEEKLILLFSNITNKRAGGRGGTAGRKASKHTKLLISKASLNRPKSAATRELARLNQTGKTYSVASKAKMRDKKLLSTLALGQPFEFNGKNYCSPLNPTQPVNLPTPFIAYHIWAQEISGLTIPQYCINNIVRPQYLASWRAKYPNLANKKLCVKYSPNFITEAIRLYLKSKISQNAFAKQLQIPLTTLNNWLKNA